MEVCHNCCRHESFLRDCAMHKIYHLKYLNVRADKGKNRYQVPIKSRTRVTTIFIVKQTLPSRDDPFSKFDDTDKSADVSMLAVEVNKESFDSKFTLKENTRDEEKNEITLSYLKENLDNYSARKIKRLGNVLIDSMCEIIMEKIGQ